VSAATTGTATGSITGESAGLRVGRIPGTVTIVVPTFNERDNIGPLLDRLERVLPADGVEVLFVDDSVDDTPETIREIAASSGLPVWLLHRTAEHRQGGLGGAVVAGLRATQADWVLVMDADLQHPPETVPALLAAAAGGAHDVVVASRYTDGGSAGGLANGARRAVSSGAGTLARTLFPRRMAGCTDPMSGFFAVRRAALDLERLRPDGFKILLEILAQQRGLQLVEVPFTFAARLAGESKAGIRQGIVYLRHLLSLRTRGMSRLSAFLAIGASGVVVNMAAMAVLLAAGLHHLLATVVSAVVAVSWNFALGEAMVFRAHRRGRWWGRYARYAGVNSLDIPVRVGLIYLLVDLGPVPVMPATLACIGMVSVFRFVAIDRLVYRRRSDRRGDVVDLRVADFELALEEAHEAS
jgi:dolichol-phosphate mannosyltransferase